MFHFHTLGCETLSLSFLLALPTFLYFSLLSILVLFFFFFLQSSLVYCIPICSSKLTFFDSLLPNLLLFAVVRSSGSSVCRKLRALDPFATFPLSTRMINRVLMTTYSAFMHFTFKSIVTFIHCLLSFLI